MANQYGTKAWAKWANGNLEIALALLKTPDKLFDENITCLDRAVKTLEMLKNEISV